MRALASVWVLVLVGAVSGWPAEAPRSAAFAEDRVVLALEGVAADLGSLSEAVATHQSSEVRRRAALVLKIHLDTISAGQVHEWLAAESEPTVRQPLGFLLGLKGDERGVEELRGYLREGRSDTMALLAAQFLARLGIPDGFANIEAAIREAVEARDLHRLGWGVSSLRHLYCSTPEAIELLEWLVGGYADLDGEGLAHAIHHAWAMGAPEGRVIALSDRLVAGSSSERVRGLVENHRYLWQRAVRAECEGVRP